MKTLIFSDTHLSLRFDERKFKYLEGLIESADRIIINGDFWDSRTCTFDEFINSKWSGLFPLLKSKKTIYICGNHDPLHRTNGGVELFSNHQTNYHNFDHNGYKVHVEHGNRIILISITSIIRSKLLEKLDWISSSIVEKLGIKLFGHNFLRVGTFHNKRINLWKKENLNGNDLYVYAHTHLPELNEKRNILNTGVIRHGVASYAILNNEGYFLIKERY